MFPNLDFSPRPPIRYNAINIERMRSVERQDTLNAVEFEIHRKRLEPRIDTDCQTRLDFLGGKWAE